MNTYMFRVTEIAIGIADEQTTIKVMSEDLYYALKKLARHLKYSRYERDVTIKPTSIKGQWVGILPTNGGILKIELA